MRMRHAPIAAAGVLVVAVGGAEPAPARAAGFGCPGGPHASPAASLLATPEVVPLRPTQSAPGSRGTMTLTQPGSPFGITVDPEGRQAYDIMVQVQQLRRRGGAAYVVWAAKPELDEHVQLGVLGDDGRLAGRVAWNKFLVFVSEEVSADIERWQGPIVLTGLSPSGRLHTMAGHGPFEGVSCQQYY